MTTTASDARPRHFAAACVATIVCTGLAANLYAQTPPIDWHRGTTLAGFVGAASAASDTDAAAGASIGWEVTPRFGVEGRGFWMRAGVDQEAFSATVAGRAAIRTGRPFVPFAALGVGLYYASFDSQATNVPSFYRDRMTSPGAPHAFTDFALSFGGGVDVFLSRHLSLRPELTVLLATTTSDARAVTVYGAQFAYHFEDHPITAQRR